MLFIEIMDISKRKCLIDLNSISGVIAENAVDTLSLSIYFNGRILRLEFENSTKAEAFYLLISAFLLSFNSATKEELTSLVYDIKKYLAMNLQSFSLL